MGLVDSDESDSNMRETKSGKLRISDDIKSRVITNSNGVPRSRIGRGYSNMEIVEAFANIGLGNQNVSNARAFHIHVDHLRRSAHPENVTQLTTVLRRYLPSNKAKNKGKKQSQSKEKTATQKTAK
jgi:ribosomal protein L13E